MRILITGVHGLVGSKAKIKKALGIEQLPDRAKDGLTITIKSFNL